MRMRFSYLALTLAWLTVAGHAQESGRASEEINPVHSRELIRQWVKTERMISEEKSAWQAEKQQMQDLLEIYGKELSLLNEELNAAGGSAGLVDESKERLETSLNEFREARQFLRETVARLLPRLQNLAKRFPAPLVEELDADIEFLHAPEALEDPRDALKSMIAILNAAERFNRTLTLAEETRVLGNGKQVSVNVLYLGLCRAYYASATGSTAGMGVPSTTDQWQWTEQNEIAEQVRQTISVYLKARQPQLVNLPVQLQTGDTRKTK